MKTYKVCIIGQRGHIHYVLNDLPALTEVDVVAVSSGEEDYGVEKVMQMCREAGHNPDSVADYIEMLSTYQPDIVCIDGPFFRHAEMALAAMDCGAHVFCEKTVAFTIDELTQLKKKREEKDVELGAMMGLRYHPAFYTAFRQCQAGVIGKVRMITAQKSYVLGQRDPMFFDRKTYGGTIPWVGSHAIDWVKWFSGEKFLKVSALHSTAENRGHGDLEMTALCQFSMTGDVIASVNLDYYRPKNAATHGDDRVRVVGTEGIIEVSDSKVKLINGENNGEEYIETSCDRTLFADFVSGLQKKNECLLSTDDVFEVTEACLLARESADTGKEILF